MIDMFTSLQFNDFRVLLNCLRVRVGVRVSHSLLVKVLTTTNPSSPFISPGWEEYRILEMTCIKGQ